MINVPIKIKIPEIWSGEFEKNEWGPINFLVGANGTGKSLLSLKISNGFSAKGYLPRLLTAERLAGFEKKNYNFFTSDQLAQGLNISIF